ncbi:MAG TPA: cell surface protein, partial [Bacteroidales bacterium]|nr:cell surface protein [Bacteroidales bacterium]
GPSDGRLYITNAVDYQQRGYLLMAGRNGEIIDSVRVGIIPGAMCFKVE